MDNFDPNKPSEGLGDTIAKLTHALGIDKVADKLAEALGKDDCGCKRRRELLNDMFSYNKNEDNNDVKRETNSGEGTA